MDHFQAKDHQRSWGWGSPLGLGTNAGAMGLGQSAGKRTPEGGKALLSSHIFGSPDPCLSYCCYSTGVYHVVLGARNLNPLLWVKPRR